MLTLGTVVLLVYAVLMLVGGVIGYRTAGSKASLVSGITSGLLLLGALGWARAAPRAGFLAAALIALLLTVVFAIRVSKTGKFMPSGMLLVLSIVALAVLAMTALRIE